MSVQEFMGELIDILVVFATDLLVPFMLLLFFVGIAMRLLAYYTVKREEWFAREFEKRVDAYVSKSDTGPANSFFVMTKRLLERTFYEVFELRAIRKKRRPDAVMCMADRIFLVNEGVARMVKDLLKNVKHMKLRDGKPKFYEVSRNVLKRNPCFSKVLGIFPTTVFNDFLAILPGVFIVLGIFGTFLGIMKALPDLGGMDVTDSANTEQIMDMFLIKVSFSMSTSIVGIVLSLATSFLNAMFSPIRVFWSAVERIETCLDNLWNFSENNKLPKDLPDFDENKDPLEALAERAIEDELNRKAWKSRRPSIHAA